MRSICILATAVGCAHAAFGQVVNNDSGDLVSGSLRQVIASAASGATVRFDANTMDGATVVLGDTILIDKTIAIDASNLPNGLIINGNSRIAVKVTTSGYLFVRAVSFTNGLADTQSPFGLEDDTGGAIQNKGELELERCTLSGNHAAIGGGAIANLGASTATLTQCTIYGNTCSDPARTSTGGGGIYNFGTLRLVHCTIANNSTETKGGGIYDHNTGLTLKNSVVADNAAPVGPDIDINAGLPALEGVNFVSDLADSGLTAGSALLAGDAALLPFGDYGGPTPTLHPFAFSPLVDAAAVDPTITIDQRGYPRPIDGNDDNVVGPDIGAVEVDLYPVVHNGLDDGEGSLRDVVRTAAYASSITFASGVTTVDLTSGPIPIDKLLFINGDAASPVAIGGAAGARRFEIADAFVAMTGLRILNADIAGAGEGGAIRLVGDANLTANDCTFENNRADNGGVLATATNSFVSLNRVSFINNVATNAGGAILNRGQLEIDTATFADNAAFRGGAIEALNGSGFTIQRTTFHGNRATDDGGAIYSNSTLDGAQNSLSSCTFHLNTATNGIGGAIRNFDGRTTLSYCTLVGNLAAPGLGGAIGTYGDTLTETVLDNCLVAGNGASDLDFTNSTNNNSYASGGANIVGIGGAITTNNPFTLTGDVVNVVDPQVAPIGDYGGPTDTLPPLPGSPAIDAGGPGFDLPDQRGVARSDGHTDSGSVEAIPSLVSNPNDSGPGSLRHAVTYFVPTNPVQPQAITFSLPQTERRVELTSGPLIIRQPLQIQSPTDYVGVTLDAVEEGRILEVESGVGPVILAGLNVTGGAVTGSGQGAAIWVKPDAVVRLNRCTLYDNTCEFQGGAIYTEGALVLDHCTLVQNHARYGGAIYARRVSSSGRVDLIHCTLAENAAFGEGGGVYTAFTPLDIHNSILGNNAAGADGPDLFDLNGTAAITLTGTNLLGSLAGSGIPVSDPAYRLGDPRLSSLSLHGGPTFTVHPLAGSDAIDAAGGQTLASFDQRGDGFARWVDGDGNGSVLLDIGAVEAGPPVWVQNALDFGSGSIPHGSLREAIAFASVPGTVIRFAPTAFPATIRLGDEGYALSNFPTGQCIFVDASDIPFTPTGTPGVVIDGNDVARPFSVSAANCLSLYGLHLLNGYAEVEGAYPDGGGFRLRPGAQGSLDHCLIERGRAQRGGGGLATFVADLVLTHTTVQDCDAEHGLGGGYWASGGTCFITDSVFSNNTSSASGGGLYLAAASSLQRCDFLDNTSTNGSGGGLYVNVRVYRLDDLVVHGNHCSEDGGGVFRIGSSLPQRMRDATLTHNTAGGNGGGFYTEFGLVHFERVVVEDNHAESGGGLYLYQGDLKQVGIHRNTAWSRGGGLYTASLSFSDDTQLENTTIAENRAHEAGGIYHGYNHLKLHHATVTANVGTNLAGGIYYERSLRLENSIVGGNSNLSGGTQEIQRGSATNITSVGRNIVSDLRGSALQPHPDLLEVAPGLLPLGAFQGDRLTAPPALGSPAMNAALDSRLVIDQRGYPRPGQRFSTADLGAIEVYSETSRPDIDGDGMDDRLEPLFGFSPFDPHDGSGDLDGDSATNADELRAQTDPTAADDIFKILDAEIVGYADPEFTDRGQTFAFAPAADVALGDLDGDGDLDAFVANGDVFDTPTNTVWLNQGLHSAVLVDSGQGLGTNKSAAVALGDLDGDGDLDAFVANDNYFDVGGFRTLPNTVWLNQTSQGSPGVFVDSGQALAANDSQDVALGDLDGDGDLDAFVVNEGGDAHQIWINQGGMQAGIPGAFAASGVALSTVSANAVALGDLDKDGDLDAFIANVDREEIWFNQGGSQGGTPGLFAPSTQLLPSRTISDVALGDVDGDTDLDAILPQEGGNAVYLYLNQGDGTFTFINISSTVDNRRAHLANLDGDDDLDVFLTGSATTFSINQGGSQGGTVGDFSTPSPRPDFGNFAAADLGDLDGDGDADAFLVVGSSPYKAVLRNTSGPIVELEYRSQPGVQYGFESSGDLENAPFADTGESDIGTNRTSRTRVRVRDIPGAVRAVLP